MLDPKYEFSLEVEDDTLITAKPPKLSPREEDWLTRQLAELEARGVIAPYEPGEEPQFITPLHLVPQG